MLLSRKQKRMGAFTGFQHPKLVETYALFVNNNNKNPRAVFINLFCRIIVIQNLQSLADYLYFLFGY